MTVIAKIRPCSFHSFDPLVLRSLLWRSLFTGLFSARNRDIAQLSVPENPAYLWVGSFFNPFSDMSLAGSNDLSYTQLRHRSRARKKVVKWGNFPRNEPSITQLEVCLIFSITDYTGLVTCFWRACIVLGDASCPILHLGVHDLAIMAASFSPLKPNEVPTFWSYFRENKTSCGISRVTPLMAIFFSKLWLWHQFIIAERLIYPRLQAFC